MYWCHQNNIKQLIFTFEQIRKAPGALSSTELTFYFSRKYYLFVFFDEFYFILLGFNFVHNECTLMHLCLTLTCINYYHKNYTQHFYLQIKMKCENENVLIINVDSWLSPSWLYDFVVSPADRGDWAPN